MLLLWFCISSALHLVLTLLCFTAVLPFLWMVLTSLKPVSQVGATNWLPMPPAEFSLDDLKDSDSLLRLLTEGDAPLALHLRRVIVPGDLASVEAARAGLAALADDNGSVTVDNRRSLEHKAKTAITNALNGVVRNLNTNRQLYDEASFADVELRRRTKAVLRQVEGIVAARERRWHLRIASNEQEQAQSESVAEENVESVNNGIFVSIDDEPFLAEEEATLNLLNRYLLEDAYPSLLGGQGAFRWQNYLDVFNVIPFARFYCNSIFVAAFVTFLQVLTSALAAFSFARIDWPGRNKVFVLYLATMMLPGLIMSIPNFKIMISLGMVDTYTGLIVPAAFTAFGTFMLRQFMMTIPTSLDEAAEIDGASRWRVFWDVILPLTRPGLITLTIFTFLGNYRSFFWPLVMLKTVDKYTLPVGMLFFDSTRGQSTHLLMAAVTMSVVPMIILFLLLQKYLVKGIQLGAVKG